MASERTRPSRDRSPAAVTQRLLDSVRHLIAAAQQAYDEQPGAGAPYLGMALDEIERAGIPPYRGR